jgi:uncharacterized protein
MREDMSKEIIGQGWAFPPTISVHGGLAMTDERSELSQSIRVILSTPLGQRVMRPSFGSRLQDLVFAPNNNQTIAQARRFVEEALGMWEPRIQVSRVDVRPDSLEQSCLLISIEYVVKATHDRRSLTYPFYLSQDKASVSR